MRIIKFVLGQLQANCYLLIKDNDCLIVDPADEASFILEELQRLKLNPVALMATHGHFDHVMATGEIQLSHKLPLYINNKDKFLINRLDKTAKYYLGSKTIIIPIAFIENIRVNNILEINKFKFKIISTPGHTPGSVCFYFNQENIIFTGDTLFKGGIGRWDFSYSRKEDLKKSLGGLLKLPGDTIVYPGHGEETLIRKESAVTSSFF